MKHSFSFFIEKLGERPLLVLLLMPLLSTWLCHRLISFVALLSDRCECLFIDCTRLQEIWVMAVCIWVVLAVVLWRVMVADKVLRQVVLGKYQEALRRLDSDAQKTIRRFAEGLGRRSRLDQKMKRLITLAPEPFVAVLAVLFTASISLYVARFYWGESVGLVICNFPWTVAVVLVIYLIYNDVWVIERLKARFGDIGITDFADFLALVERFLKQLTPTERKIVKMYYVEELRYQDIMKELNVERTTVNSHLSNINHKWAPFKIDIGERISMKQLLQLFAKLRGLDGL